MGYPGNLHEQPVRGRASGSARSPHLDPVKEAQAVAALKESLRQLGADDDDALLLDSIEGETSLFEAIDKLLLKITEDVAMAKGADAAALAMTARAERFEKRAEASRALIEQALFIAELPKLERPAATLSLVNRPAKVEVAEEADIPAEFWKVGDPKLDKKALLAALKEGRAVPGACLSNAAPSLTIRTA
jgi:hypothetical protein